MDDDPPRWLYDPISPEFIQLHAIRETVYFARTGFQLVEIINTPAWGRCLVLDGKIQSSELDEFIYHEALVHPALISYPNPQIVLIAGGGEGATLREVLTHHSIQKAVMVDLDSQAVDVCRQHLPSWHQGAFDDSRVELLHLDARKYIAETKEKFDIIIMDVTDPLEEGPSSLLYTQQFYEMARDRLMPGGILAVQSEPCSWGNEQIFVAINSTLYSVFPSVLPYQTYIPSFGSMWGFNLAGFDIDRGMLSVQEIDNRITARMTRHPKFYDGIAHQGMFSLPKNLRDMLSKSQSIITDEKPAVLYY